MTADQTGSDETRDALADLARGVPEGPAAIHFCPVPSCRDIWESEGTCIHAVALDQAVDHAAALTQAAIAPGDVRDYRRAYSEQVDRAEAAEGEVARLTAALAQAKAEGEQVQARLRDLTGRLGFGDNITEPQANNDTIVRWSQERDIEAQEWREHQLWLNDCAKAGCDPTEDCPVHAPACHPAHRRADREETG